MRCRRILIAADTLLAFLQGEPVRVLDNRIPANAHILGAYTNRDGVWLIVSSNDYPSAAEHIPEGDRPVVGVAP